MEGRGK